MQDIRWVQNTMPPSSDPYTCIMTQTDAVRDFHRGFAQYAVTPLRSLRGMAEALGLGAVFVKDESYRFGLNAFKVLGGSYAIARAVAEKLGRPIEETGYAFLTSPECRAQLGQTTFFTATDGNHGRGVAWSARQLGQRAVVRMPKGTSKSRLENIRREGATVTIEDGNYDDCVRLAAREAREAENGVLVQDTAWEGYTRVPTWIMQGYGTMAREAEEQMAQCFVDRPTHIFVQAGVGSLAGAIVAYYQNRYPENTPIMTVVESTEADCLYRGAAAGDAAPRSVTGALNTIMAGLACGEPNPIAWDILRNHASFFVACPDWVTVAGMRLLAAPNDGDARIVSGESGAVGMGLLASIMLGERYRPLRHALGLDKQSRVLLFSTEGDTDPDSYRKLSKPADFSTDYHCKPNTFHV